MQTCEKELSRKEKEHLIRYNNILKCALELFSQKGYHNVSIQDIANNSEFAVGSLYKYFKSKEDLYKVLIKNLSQMFHKSLIESLKIEKDEIEKILNYVQVKKCNFIENEKAVQLYFSETRGINFNIIAGLDIEIKELHNDLLKQLASVFDSGIKKNLFQKFNSFDLAIALDSITNTILFKWFDNNSKIDVQTRIDSMLKIFFNQVKT